MFVNTFMGLCMHLMLMLIYVCMYGTQGWPRSDAYVKKKYEELLQSHSEWPDRYVCMYE